MSLESDYVKYGLEATFTLLAVSSTYLVDFSRPETLLALTTIPILFGYTAYISSESFQRASLISLAALAFIPLGLMYAVIAIIIAAGNILVSFFSRGETFRDFYSTASLPLLFAGIFVGLAVFGSLSSSPQQLETATDTVSETITASTEKVMQQTGLNQSQARETMINSISTATVSSTHAYVVNRTSEQLGPQDLANVSSAFREAREEVPERIIEEASNTGQAQSISDTVQGAVESIFSGAFLLLLIPLSAVVVYSVHPVVGILTALSGFVFRKADGYVSETS